MKIAIVEDESLASDYLKSILIKQQILSIAEMTVLKTVKESVTFFKNHTVDLAFMDIHLGDGNSLEIFERVTLSCPIIFITAYDSYAIKVFKHFTIDYLLKPFEEESLLEALHKYKNLKKTFNTTATALSFIQNKNFEERQQRFLVHQGYKLKSISDMEISCFLGSGKHLFLFTHDGNSFLYNDTIKDIINKLDPKYFFKVNRRYIFHISAIEEIIKHSSQRIELKVSSTIPTDGPILVSKNEINNLKEWLDK